MPPGPSESLASLVQFNFVSGARRSSLVGPSIYERSTEWEIDTTRHVESEPPTAEILYTNETKTNPIPAQSTAPIYIQRASGCKLTSSKYTIFGAGALELHCNEIFRINRSSSGTGATQVAVAISYPVVAKVCTTRTKSFMIHVIWQPVETSDVFAHATNL